MTNITLCVGEKYFTKEEVINLLRERSYDTVGRHPDIVPSQPIPSFESLAEIITKNITEKLLKEGRTKDNDAKTSKGKGAYHEDYDLKGGFMSN